MTRVSGNGRERFAEESRSEHELYGGFDHYRLVGEDAPAWLPTSLAVLGLVFAMAASSAIVSPDAFEALVASGPATERGFPGREKVAETPPPIVERTTPPKRLEESAATPRSRPVEHPPAPPPVVAERPPPAPTPPLAETEGAARRTEPAPPPAALEQTAPKEPAPPPVVAAETTPKATVPIPAERQSPPAQTCRPAIVVPFAYNSARPHWTGTETAIDELVQWMARHEDATLVVEGHADSSGTEQYNVLLSYWRAKAVVSQFVSRGIPEKRIIARAAGASDASASPAEAARHRRVVVQVNGVETCREDGDQTERQ